MVAAIYPDIASRTPARRSSPEGNMAKVWAETGKVVISDGKSGLVTNALAPTVLEQRGCIEDFKA